MGGIGNAAVLEQAGAAAPVYLSPVQVAEALGISTKTLQRMRADGIGPTYVVVSANCIRYPAPAVAEWLDERTVDPLQVRDTGETS